VAGPRGDTLRATTLLVLAGALAATGCDAGGGPSLVEARRCPERPAQPAGDSFGARALEIATGAALALAGCGDGGRPAARAEARRCLERLDLHVTPRGPTRAEQRTLEAELYVNDILRGRVQVVALFYLNEEAAGRVEPIVRRNVAVHGGVVERHGSVMLVWIGGHGHPLAERTRDCLL
jgi:hypothetical protein